MRWLTFAVVAYFFLVLEVSLRNVLVLGNIAPSFTAVLVVFLALFAPRSAALWGCWLLGLLVDLCIDLPYGQGRAAPMIGAHALGYVFGCFLLLQLRAMLYRGSALTLAVMTVLFVIASSLVVVFILAIHGWYEPQWAELRPAGELLRRMGIALYSGVLALLVGPVLLWSTPAWAFLPVHQRLAGRR